MLRLSLFVVFAFVALAGPSAAQPVSLDGYFIALSDCAANKKKDSDNPGDVHLERMRAYETLARNSTPGTHYQVRVPGAPVTESRWVPMTCGAYAPKESLVVVDGTPPTPDLAPNSIEYVLAASWEPAFCATSAGHGKQECQTQTSDRFDATHFSLHGLWPDDLDDKAIFPCYCDRGPPRGCSGNLADDARVDISPPVLAKLAVVMPGVQSNLQGHEWPKHGSCYEDDKTGDDRGADPDEYFSEAIALMDQLNASPVAALFAGNIGARLTRDQIEAAFDEAFGDGAPERLLIRCNGNATNAVISELWIGLKGDIGPESQISDLILAAPTTANSTNDKSCDGGKVLAVEAN